MTLSYQLTGSPTEYLVDVSVLPGQHTYRNELYWPTGTTIINPTPLIVTPTGTTNMVTYTDTSHSAAHRRHSGKLDPGRRRSPDRH